MKQTCIINVCTESTACTHEGETAISCHPCTSVGSDVPSNPSKQKTKSNIIFAMLCKEVMAVREERNHSRIVSQPLSITCMQFFHLSSRTKEKRSFPYFFFMKKIIINMS